MDFFRRGKKDSNDKPSTTRADSHQSVSSGLSRSRRTSGAFRRASRTSEDRSHPPVAYTSPSVESRTRRFSFDDPGPPSRQDSNLTEADEFFDADEYVEEQQMPIRQPSIAGGQPAASPNANAAMYMHLAQQIQEHDMAAPMSPEATMQPTNNSGMLDQPPPLPRKPSRYRNDSDGPRRSRDERREDDVPYQPYPTPPQEPIQPLYQQSKFDYNHPPRPSPPLAPFATSPEAQAGPSRSEPPVQPRPRSPSRSRPQVAAATAAAASQQTTYAKFCESCEVSDKTVAYCNVCQFSLCETCWDGQLPHKRNRKGIGGVPHEKTRPAIAEKVRNALEPPADDITRERLCAEDQSTTWFGIERPADQSTPIFQDYGRFADLMSSTDPKKISNGTLFVGDTSTTRDTRTPGLVSFVGQTGAGKSTLIKLMIDLSADVIAGTYEFQTPVVGSRGAHVPTSEDVHLYIDPKTWDSQDPLLFADCEGLEGGEREPLGALLKRKRKDDKSSDDGGGRFRKAVKIISERELQWASAHRAGREFAVTNLYPRILFTFSDAIVFVLKNPRVVEHVFERLVNWANAAIETSVNQPLLPHAIIVLNASENDIDPNLWDVQVNTSTILDDLSKTVNQNSVFKKFADLWRQRGKTVDTLEQLVLCYYSSIQIIRIPEEGRPRLMQDQVAKLYDAILTASIAARYDKLKLRMLLDVEELQNHLEYAFSHFSGSLEFPFDFVEAGFINSPIPPDFGGNILKLAINIMEVWKGQADGANIFQALSYMVASCIMIESTRNNVPGAADQVFPQYLEHIDAALENFCAQHWPCEFVLPGTQTRCVNVLSGHGKDHQSKDGKIIAAGNFESSFQYNGGTLKEFRDAVFGHLWRLLNQLQAHLLPGGEEASQLAASIHRDQVLQKFYRGVSNGSNVADEFDSHTVCLCCLFEAPEHPLPCGHVLCTPCVRLYGHARGDSEITMYNCPLDGNAVLHSWTIRLKPKSAGVRILTLDGGGMRGIVELEILRALQNAMGVKILIQKFFDLIVGTSTGGLITLGLGAMNWTVDECITEFEAMVGKAFTRRTGSSIWGIGFIVDNFNHSKYETKPLEGCLQDAFTRDQYLFGGRRHANDPDAGSSVKVAVTASSTSGRSAFVFGNYNRTCADKLSYQFLRPEKKSAELKIWQAARATSAAPRYFKPFMHEPTQRSFIDGAVFHNNPIEVADRERKLIWPELEESYPDIVLSLGTATSPSLKRAESVQIAQRGMVNHATALLRLAKNHMATSIECEQIWDRYLGSLSKSIKQSRFVRVNPELPGDVPPLDDVKAMPDLQRNVRERLKFDSKIRNLAVQLIATCFYFEPVSGVEESEQGGHEVEGRILSRLQQPREIFELGKFFQRSRKENNGRLVFVIKEQDKMARPEHTIEITENIISRMVQQGTFSMPAIIHIPHRAATTEILLYITKDRIFPISGFPRCLFNDGDRGNSPRETVESNPNRWAGNSFRSRAARRAWTQPSIDKRQVDIDMPDFSKPKKLLRKINDKAHGSSQDRPISPGDSTGGRSAATDVFRSAFRALARPVRVRQSRENQLRNSQPDLETVRSNSSEDLDVYRVAEQEGKAYSRYLSTLSTPSQSGISGFSRSASGRTPLPEEAKSVPGLYEMEAGTSWPVDMTGDTRETSVMEGRVELPSSYIPEPVTSQKPDTTREPVTPQRSDTTAAMYNYRPPSS